jgi:uncharacterized protein YodC (DUF2158 family)
MASTMYQPGDLVQLKSGGPKMVVEQYHTYGSTYECTWFAGSKHNKQQFKEEALQPFNEDDE